MNPRLTHATRAAMAAIVLSAMPAQSLSKTYDGQPNCSAPTTAERQSSINYDIAGRTVQEPVCQRDGQCTYPCEGDSTCDYPCPPQQPQSVPSPTEGHQTHHNGSGLFPFIAGIIAVGGIALAADQLTGKDWASSEELDANGPRFPIQQKLGRFQVQGYVAAGWPVAVDLDTEPGTSTWLEVRFKDHERPQSIDLTRPEGGRRVAVVQLQGGYGPVRKARYTVYSALVREGQEPLYRPMRVFAIGAGPNAVGALNFSQGASKLDPRIDSVSGQALLIRSAFTLPSPGSVASAQSIAPGALAVGAAAFDNPAQVGSFLSVTAFGPQYPSRPAEVSWAVAAQRPFQRSELEVLQLPREPDGSLIAVQRANIDLFARPHASGSWGAVPGLTNVRAGTYLLQARAWRTKAGGGDWTGAFAPRYVYIR